MAAKKFVDDGIKTIEGASATRHPYSTLLIFCGGKRICTLCIGFILYFLRHADLKKIEDQLNHHQRIGLKYVFDASD